MTAPNDRLDGQMVKYGLFVFIETWVMSRIARCWFFYLEKVTNMIPMILKCCKLQVRWWAVESGGCTRGLRAGYDIRP